MHSPCLATPAVADGELLIRTETELFCIAGGERRSTETTSSSRDPAGIAPPDPSSLIPHPSSLSNPQSPIPTSHSWPLFRGDAAATGVARATLPEKLELLWTFSTKKGGFESTAAIVDGTVYIGCTDGKLYALDLATGKKRWEFSTPLGFTASAAVRDGRVYIGDSDGTFYCIDAATGNELWDFDDRRRDQLQRQLPRRPRPLRLAGRFPLLPRRRLGQARLEV